MRIAITGSSGLIGSALVRSLEADGHDAVRVVRAGGGPGAVRWDIERGEIDAAGLEGLDGVVHLAGEGIGEKRWSEDQKRRIKDSRSKGTALLVDALVGLTAKPPALVSGSAIGLYGDRGDEQLTEASPVGTRGFLPEVVQAWEAAATTAEAAGIRVAKVRSGIVLAADGGALQRLVTLCRLGVLGKIGSGGQWMSWVALDDEVGAIRYLLDNEVAGPVNVTAPNPVTNEVFTKTLGRVVKRPTFMPIPSFGPKLLLGSELAESLLFEGQRVYPEVLLEAGYEFRHIELEPALRTILSR